MSKSKQTSPPARLETTLRELADLAKVPAAERASFFEDVSLNIQAATEQVELGAHWTKASNNANKIWEHARGLYEMVSTLNKTETEILQRILTGQGKFLFARFSGDGISGLQETAYQLALLFSLLAGKPHPSFPSQTPVARKRGRSPGGRPKGAVKSPIFQNFIRDLRTTVRAHGGKLTVDKDANGGSMIEALQKLKSHLPQRFIPNVPSGPTLRKLVDQISAIERELKQMGELD